MASAGSTQAIIKRREDDLALMPPPLVKRIKRPTETLDEDDYTEALSDIIARDYYPGLREAEAQEEYLNALDSKNPVWIRDAERKLRQATNGGIELKKVKRKTRDTRYDTPRSYKQAEDTPRGHYGADTPVTVAGTEVEDGGDKGLPEQDVDTSSLSLSAYQAKYTSEDNASFNTLLDKQNDKRRQKHAHLWTADQRIPAQRLIAHRAQQQALLKDKADYESTNGKELVPLTTGSTDIRSAKPASWKTTNPANTFMFAPSTSIDEQGLLTIQDQKEALSKAGPKQIIHENTRFPPSGPRWEADDEDDATSIHTSFIARRNARGDGATDLGAIAGAETPRVNGYAFIDEDEEPPTPAIKEEPTYRDLLAGQAGDGVPNPFRLNETRLREDLHHRLVEQDAEKKRAKQKETTKGGKEVGNMTPAARRMMERLGGRTPTAGSSSVKEDRREDWTPVATPRRHRAAV
ncbi:hypothetical protein LTR70_005883 [Exophiala xenobiotica]|uniref:Uncharacterized protein n=1 Tax=Lithohypha guttulata TaxID=1690604 RepID=A0ABR0JUN3_9EURO|nr:hypothetical protein LTR24_010216 [Lithohypha guttulata]KAK5317266.1 hypothetical protein LTR70_005883 [Exophiala xenobiotica]